MTKAAHRKSRTFMVTTHAKWCSHSDLVIDAIKPEQSAQAAVWVGLQLDESQHGVKEFLDVVTILATKGRT